MTMFDEHAASKRILKAYHRDLTTYVQKFLTSYLYEKDEPSLDDAKTIAARMIDRVAVVNAKTWRQAARKSMRGRRIYQALQRELTGPVGRDVRRLVARNAELISSIPAELREMAAGYSLRQHEKGMRHEVVAEELKKRFPGIAQRRIELIARTEVSKASTAITRARAEDIGVDWYEWSTSKDQRVRPSHRKMASVLVNWNDPPSPEALDHIESTLGHYHAGDAPNCRCTPLPLVDVSEVAWPHRVYLNGRIQMITLVKFRRLLNSEQIAA